MKSSNKGNEQGRWALRASCTAMISAGFAFLSVSEKIHWLFKSPAYVFQHVIQCTVVSLKEFRVSILRENIFIGAEIVHG